MIPQMVPDPPNDFRMFRESFERLEGTGRLELGLIGCDPALAWPDLGWSEWTPVTGPCPDPDCHFPNAHITTMEVWL